MLCRKIGGFAIVGGGLLLGSYMLYRQRRGVIVRTMTIRSDEFGLLDGFNLETLALSSGTKIFVKCKDENGNNEKDSRVLEIVGKENKVKLVVDSIKRLVSSYRSPRLVLKEIPIPKYLVDLISNARFGEFLKSNLRCKFSLSLSDTISLRGTEEQVSHGMRAIKEKFSHEERILKAVQKNSSLRAPRLSLTSPIGLKREKVRLFPEKDGAMNVYVSFIRNPYHFFIQKVGLCSTKLDDLIRDMTSFYDSEENQKLCPLRSIEENDVIATKFTSDGNWCRGLVIKATDPDNSFFEIEFVDFGDREVKSKDEIFELKAEFLKLNFQAILCSMANIAPISNVEWNKECCQALRILTHCSQWQVLSAKIVGYGYSNTKRTSNYVQPKLLLFASCQNDILDIGKEMIRLGHAKPRDI